jgi:hypothetical protein
MKRFVDRSRRAPSLVSPLVLAGLLAISARLVYSQTNSPHPTPASPEPTDFSGVVAETMNTAGYTYFLVDSGKAKTWAAAPQFSVKVGDKVAVADGMPMPNYHSKTLNRDFELVVFTGNLTVNGVSVLAGAASPPRAGQLPEGHPPISGTPTSAGDVKPTINLTGIKKAEGGKSIAEIYSDKSKLSGKKVKVRGRVVKYNGDIMGKNWIHIQDGTGSAGSNDLAVTSTAGTKVGALILVNGTVAINKDFGGGYQYNVIIEDAQLTAE